MTPARRAVGALALLGLAACQAPPGPIFPDVQPPLVWPPPPDVPRVRYVGALRGESSLGRRPTGWAAFEAVLSGPPPTVEFLRPAAVAVRGAQVYVADAGIGAVHRLDLETRAYALLRGNPADPLRVPLDVAVVRDDTLVVVDRGRAAVDLFDLAGNWRQTRRWPELAAPVAAAWDAARGVLWVADVEAHACRATSDLATLRDTLGRRGAGPGEFNFPTAVAAAADGTLAVVDAMNFRVQLVGPAGNVTALFGRKGDAAGDFSRPRDVAFDSDGHVYVLDNQFENIQIFDPTGRLLMAFGEGGDGPGQFALPSGLAIDAQDRIWVADSYNRRVQVFQYLTDRAPAPAGGAAPR